MIHINTRNFHSHLTGVQRYTKSVLQYLPESTYHAIGPQHNFAAGYRGHLWEQYMLPTLMHKNGDPLLWCPGNTAPVNYKNQVMTIHDVIPFEHPEWFNPIFVKGFKYIVKKAAQNSRGIITVSEFSKERIVHFLGVPESKVKCIYNGVDIQALEPVEIKLPFQKYLLSVGSIEPRKNVENLIKAWMKIKDTIDPAIGLVIVGKKGISRIFKAVEFDDKVSLDRVHFTGHVSDEELSFLYKNAFAFSYLSLYEGFGLPALEALAYGVPVLTSNNTSLQELCSDKALLIDPLSQTAIEDGLLEILQNQTAYKKIAEKSMPFVNKLSWKNCTNETLGYLTEFL